MYIIVDIHIKCVCVSVCFGLSNDVQGQHDKSTRTCITTHTTEEDRKIKHMFNGFLRAPRPEFSMPGCSKHLLLTAHWINQTNQENWFQRCS